MIRRLAAFLLLGPLSAVAQDPLLPPPPPLPPPLTEWLAKWPLPPDGVALVVKEAGASEALVAHNAARAMNPASVIKVLTTYAGLELLGPAYSWKTEVL